MRLCIGKVTIPFPMQIDIGLWKWPVAVHWIGIAHPWYDHSFTWWMILHRVINWIQPGDSHEAPDSHMIHWSDKCQWQITKLTFTPRTFNSTFRYSPRRCSLDHIDATAKVLNTCYFHGIQQGDGILCCFHRWKPVESWHTDAEAV